MVSKEKSAAQAMAHTLLAEVLHFAGLKGVPTAWQRTRRGYIVTINVDEREARSVSFSGLEIDQLPVNPVLIDRFIYRVESALD